MNMAEEAAKEYANTLKDLTFNSKIHINLLTMIAGEHKEYAKDIVRVIENHVKKVIKCFLNKMILLTCY